MTMEALVSTLVPESRLLLEAAAVAAPATGVSDPEARASLSWERVVDRAVQQRCAPLLCRWLRSAGDGLPATAALALDRLYVQNLLRMEGIQRQLEEVAGALQQAGIPAMPMKGAYLARAVYPDPALRPMADIDLMVPRDAVPHLPDTLAPLGYRLAAGMPISLWDETWRENELCRFNAPGKRSLEFHVALGSRTWPPPKAVWSRSRPWDVGPGTLREPSPTDLLIHLIQHLVHHLDGPRPIHLVWLADVARVLARFEGQIDPAALADAFDRLRIQEYATLLLRFCGGELRAPMPVTDFGFWILDWPPRPRRSAECAGASSLTAAQLLRMVTAAPDELAECLMDATAAARSRFRRRGPLMNAAYTAGLLLPSPEYLTRRFPDGAGWPALVRHYRRLLEAIGRHVGWGGAAGRASEEHTPHAVALAALFARCRVSGETIRLPAAGTSMIPAIRPGDVLVVHPEDADGFSVGDILVWQEGERLIAHRVLRIFVRDGLRMFQTGGDARRSPDPAAPAEQALGRVIAVERSGSDTVVLRPHRLAGVARACGLLGAAGARAALRCAGGRSASLRR